MRKYGTTWAVFVLLLILTVFVFSLSNVNTKGELSYSNLLETIERKISEPNQPSEIEHVYVVNGDDVVRVKFRSQAKTRSVVVPSEVKEHLIKCIRDARIPLSAKTPDTSGMWLNIISSFFLPVLVLVGLLFMFRSAQASRSRQVDALSVTLVDSDKFQELEKRLAQLEAEVSILLKGQS